MSADRGYVAPGIRINDDDRAQWIDNDEPLYRWWLSSQMDKRAFIRANRAAIDQAIASVLNREPLS